MSESSGSSGGEGSEDSLSQYSTKTAAPEKTQDLSNIIDEEFNKLDVGRILFNPPSKMKEGVPEIIEVRISKDLSANLTEGLKGRGISQVQNISVSTFIHVSLTGDSFAISSKSEEGQIVTSKGFTEWDWEVTPLKSGPQKLWLTVTAEIRIPGSKEKKQLVVLDKDIDVEINPQGSIENAVAETTKDPKWLIVTLIIPGIAWIYKRWTKSKE